MKKRCVRSVLSFFLAAIMLVSVVGCGGNTPSDAETTPDTSPADTGSDTEETTSSPVTDDIKGKVDNMTVAGNDIKEYKIVYYDSDYAAECAKNIQTALTKVTGHIIPIRRHTGKETEYEILVGKTGREESNAVRANYSRPNVYYDIKVSGKCLVVMGEGYTVLNEVTGKLVDYILNMSNSNSDLGGAAVSGNIIDKVDTLQKSMVNRADGTDLRVFHWNMAAPYLDPAVTAPPVVYTSNKTRGEVMADIILQLMPDIITTNEFYASHNGNTVFYDAVMGELGEYYVCLDSPYDKDKPAVGADAIKGKTINSNIIYRKDIGLSVVTSSWRYSTEKTTTSANNPGGWVYYHGSHTAVFSYSGRKFIVSVAHYANSGSENKWAKEHIAAINDAQKASGSTEVIPVILTGDLYTSAASSSANSGYKYIASQGYIDSQRKALVNANNNISHGTFHKIGERQISRISEDFIWHTDKLQALCFKVLTSSDIDDTSDHYPVMADIKFK
ncbi:MAG: hypothetical protein E7601_01020 [Ruminococcaceae bacterium]|nr:hypothetical protein [Oscillospiraceae bacterium]